MSWTLILVAFAFFGISYWLARRPFGLATPSKIMLAIGAVGALITVFSVDVAVDAAQRAGNGHWLGLLGTLMCLMALVGLLCLVVVWMIRRWTIEAER